MKKIRQLEDYSTEELKEILAEHASVWDSSPYDFFDVKAEYDSRFPLLKFEILGPFNKVIDKYVGPCVNQVPAHVFVVEGDQVTHVDVHEFMWMFGSDYFKSEGYVPVPPGTVVIRGIINDWVCSLFSEEVPR